MWKLKCCWIKIHYDQNYPILDSSQNLNNLESHRKEKVQKHVCKFAKMKYYTSLNKTKLLLAPSQTFIQCSLIIALQRLII